VAQEIWYLAICAQCNGGLSNIVEHPEQFMPMPFDEKPARARWVEEHMDGTGHAVLLMDQNYRGNNDATT